MTRFFATVLFACSTLLCFGQSIITVNNNSSDYDYTSVHDAVEAANSGDIILVYGTGTRYGNSNEVNISKVLTIIGEGYFRGNVEGLDFETSIQSIKFNPGSEGSRLSGIEIESLNISAENITVESCYITGQPFLNADKIRLMKSYLNREIITSVGTTRSHIISNNLFKRSNDNVLGQIESSEVYNNIFYSKLSNDTEANNNIYNSIKVLYDASNSRYALVDNLSGPPLQRNLFSVFKWTEQSLDKRYILSENSSARGIGVNGGDCGIFGGETPYVVSGIPSIPRITDLIVPGNVSPGTPLKVEFTIKGN